MPLNFELKARYSSVDKARKIARKIGARFAGTLNQRDTYFRVKSGRLKVREINGKTAELIYYKRANVPGSRYSNYLVVPLTDASAAKVLLQTAFGRWLVVNKARRLYLYENARIHIDSVAGLGKFIEFEVAVDRGKRQARKMMQLLRSEFGVNPRSVYSGSYSDMKMKK